MSMRVNTVGSDRAYTVQGFDAIATIANHLGMNATIGDYAKDVYKKMVEADRTRPKKPNVVYYVACLYVVCNNNTLKKKVFKVTTTMDVKERSIISNTVRLNSE